MLTTLAIFTPIYLGAVLPGRWFIRHHDNRRVKAFVTKKLPEPYVVFAAGTLGLLLHWP